MFKYINIKFNFFLATLFTAFSLQQINLASATNKSFSINSHNNNKIIPLSTRAKTTQESPFLDKFSSILNTELTVASHEQQSNLNNDHSAPIHKNDGMVISSTKVVKTSSLSFFLLLVISLGIFYSFFLFYKWLLSGELHKSVKLQNNYSVGQVSTCFNPENQYVTPAKDNYQATVSKLQIAFSSQVNELQEKLAETILSVEINQERGLIELMRQTVSILIDREYWTHVNYTSTSLPFGGIKAEFDATLDTEHRKLIKDKVCIRNGNTQVEQASESSYNNIYNYNYIVVTLVLCTSQNISLFNKINTKEQLSEELVKVSKLEKDELIKFDLLWNPRTADTYINNNQLLRDYSDLFRLL